ESWVIAQQAIDRRQKVRIERRLIKDAMSEPIACRDALRPLMIGGCIAEAQVEEGSAMDLPEVQRTEAECEDAHAEQCGSKPGRLPLPWRVPIRFACAPAVRAFFHSCESELRMALISWAARHTSRAAV